jgi:hypothetical protein
MAATTFASTNVPFGDFTLPRTAAAAETSGGSTPLNKLWLPLWSGEVINAYDQFNMFENMITTKTLTGGYSYEFPITGTVGLNPSWNSGVELGGYSGDTNSTSTTIKVNLDKRPMAAHFETDNVDLLVTQWDYRSELARQAGLTLANTRDRQILMALVAAGSLPPVTGDPRGLAAAAFHAPKQISSGTVANLIGATSDNEGLQVLQAIEDYLVTCQENDVPVGSVYCAVPPKVFQVIRALGIPRTAATGYNNTGAAAITGVLNTVSNYANNPLFTGSDEYGAGAPISQGMNAMTDSLDYMGVKIVKSNHIPKIDHSATANNIGGSKYNLKCSGFATYGIIFQSEAVAGLSLMGMKVDTVQDVRRNTQFTVGSMLKGTGIIKPEMVKLITGCTAANTADTRDTIATFLKGTVATNYTGGFGGEYFTS